MLMQMKKKKKKKEGKTREKKRENKIMHVCLYGKKRHLFSSF